MKEKIIICLHIALILLAYTSWIWLDYRVIAVLAVLHLTMLVVLKGCPLSHLQFPGEKDKRFYEWYMQKLGCPLRHKTRQKMRIFMQYILPAIIILLAHTVQILGHHRPLLTL